MSVVLQQSVQKDLDLRMSAVESVMTRAPQKDQLVHSGNPGKDLFAETSSHSILLDGYTADWSDLKQPPFLFFTKNTSLDGITEINSATTRMETRLAVDDTQLYLHFRVFDDRTVYHLPGRNVYSTGDRLEIHIQEQKAEHQKYLLRVIAPGKFNALHQLYYEKKPAGYIHDNTIHGYWEPLVDGYAIEVAMPKPESGSKLGFSLIDVDSDSQDFSWVGTVDPVTAEIQGRLFYLLPDLNNYLSPMVTEATRLRVFSREGWVAADINRLEEVPPESAVIDPKSSGIVTALLYRFFHWVTSANVKAAEPLVELVGTSKLEKAHLNANIESVSGRYLSDNTTVQGAFKPLASGEGYLLIEIADETVSAIINSTLVRLYLVFIVLSLILIVGLLLYAGRLSARIRKVSHAAEHALQGDGQIVQEMPGLTARDEIGDLSRGISAMLKRLSSYTDYLQNLASRLTHELRTPLAVVSTSLESIDTKRLDESNQLYLDRACRANDHLHGLIRSMSEATRLEQSVQSAGFEKMDLVQWLVMVIPMYQDLLPDRKIRFKNKHELPRVELNASPELMQQMLDKVISNAVDFTERDGTIEVSLKLIGNTATLAVFNQGEYLPDAVDVQIFEPMLSIRKKAGKEPHLGLGLYMVKLIVEAHGGSVSALNDRVRQGVIIEMNLPVS